MNKSRIKYIEEVHKELKPIFDKNKIMFLPLKGKLRNGSYFDNRKGIADSLSRKSIKFDDGTISSKFEIKKENISFYLWVACVIINWLGRSSVAKTKKVLNELILSDPKKYYIK